MHASRIQIKQRNRLNTEWIFESLKYFTDWMPPKGKKEDVPAAPAVVQRPSTANDHEIVRTVKDLQSYVNTEVKWKNRVSSAKHLSLVSELKMQKLRRLIEVCQEGLGSLSSQLQEFLSTLQDPSAVVFSNAPVNVSSAGLVTRAPAPASTQVAAAGPPPPAGKPAAGGAAKAAAPVMEETPTPEAVLRRKEQVSQLCQMLQAFYALPRLGRERPPGRPQNAAEMQREFDLASKLASPNVPVAAGSSGAGAESKATKPGGALRPPKAPRPETAGAGPGAVDPFLGDLPPSDYFILPTPKGIENSVIQYLFLLRSKKLRLEHCAALFAAELQPLQRRMTCNSACGVVGNYSLEAVGPIIAKTVALEQNLQKIRQQEDQQYLAKRAASVPPVAPPPAAGKK